MVNLRAVARYQGGTCVGVSVAWSGVAKESMNVFDIVTSVCRADVYLSVDVGACS